MEKQERSHTRARQIARAQGIPSVRRRVDPAAFARGVNLFLRGMPVAHAAQEAGLHATTLAHHLEKLGHYKPAKVKCMQWDAEKEAMIRKHYNSYEGAAFMLAEALGTTRNAIIGKARRMGLSRPKR